jgi:acetylornithine deacetylase/succinyl-diaminopimelate desuccinylase-like protein
MPLSRPLAYAHTHRQRFVAELKDFVRFPSVSAQPKHDGDLRKCATWLANHLRRVGLERVAIMPTPRHPLVYAEWRHAPERPTVLIYGHYDVQPADPLHEWRSPPFEPVVHGSNLYGRGACDDKGQMFAHVKALEAYLRTNRVLPVNVKCLFEGEEEIGSPNLTPFLSQHKSALAADVAVMSDMPMIAPDRPAITYAMRGALSLELEICGPKRDLHSGIFGGAIHNPLQALCEIIARLHDVNGRVAIPGFYDHVRRWSEQEREYMACTGPSDAQILRDAQVGQGWGERGYTLYERTTIRPALTLNGIIGGYQGPGSKAVIPASAVAKLSFRLVPNQDPTEIDRLFRAHIARLTPPTVRSSVRTNFMAKPALVNRRHPAMRAAQVAYRKGFGATPVFLRSGGTIPIVNTLQAMLGLPTVLMGFALPDDRMHAPNEKFHLPNFYHGIATSIWFLAEIGQGVGLRGRSTSKRAGPPAAMA